MAKEFIHTKLPGSLPKCNRNARFFRTVIRIFDVFACITAVIKP